MIKHIRLAALAATLVAAAPATAGFKYTTIDAPVPGTLGTVVSSVNDLGVATGYFVTFNPTPVPGSLGDYTAFTVNADGSGFTPFSRAGYSQTGASGINNAGDITGVSVTAGGAGTGYVRFGATGLYADIDPNLGGIASNYSEAIGINNSGDYTGFYVTDPAATIATLEDYAHGFVDIGGVYTTFDIDPSFAHGTEVVGINDFGVFSGTYEDNATNNRHGFIYDPVNGLFLIPDVFGTPGQEVGNVSNTGFLFYNALIPTPMSPIGYASFSFLANIDTGPFALIQVPGAYFTEGFGVNDDLQLTGLYVDGSGLHGFVASYVPEASNWAMLIAGFGLAGAAMRRRRSLATA